MSANAADDDTSDADRIKNNIAKHDRFLPKLVFRLTTL